MIHIEYEIYVQWNEWTMDNVRLNEHPLYLFALRDKWANWINSWSTSKYLMPSIYRFGVHLKFVDDVRKRRNFRAASQPITVPIFSLIWTWIEMLNVTVVLKRYSFHVQIKCFGFCLRIKLPFNPNSIDVC